VAVATLTGNQVAALVIVLGYALGAEGLVSLLLNRSDAAALTPWLPGNAGDVALYGLPARAVAPEGFDVELVASLAGVTAPPAWWVALLVLAGWTAVATAAAWWVGGRRDVT
jgi:ABC-2 type transport system permease protein